MKLFAHIALLDSDSRIVLAQDAVTSLWDMPGCTVNEGILPETALVEFAQHYGQVTTLAKAFFALNFCTTSDDVLHIVYGCRNWVGATGLQTVQTMDQTVWVKPVRLLDHNVTEACRLLNPMLTSLIG